MIIQGSVSIRTPGYVMVNILVNQPVKRFHGFLYFSIALLKFLKVGGHKLRPVVLIILSGISMLQNKRSTSWVIVHKSVEYFCS